MFRDLRDHVAGSTLATDVCVVGSGPAGLTLARHLLDTHTAVLLLESGGATPEPDLADLDVTVGGSTVGESLTGLGAGRARVWGGASTLWDGQCVRLDDDDLGARPEVPGGGWPLSAGDLAPSYAEAEALLGLDGGADDVVAAYARLPHLDANQIVHRFTHFTPITALAGVERQRFAASDDVDVVLHATVTRIRLTPGGAVDHLEVSTPEGRCSTVRARAVVLCAGAVENARLLLASYVGTEHDQVGRYLQEHPRFWSSELRGDRLAELARSYRLVRGRRVRHLPKLVLAPERRRVEEVLGAVATVDLDERSAGVEAARHLVRAVRGRRIPERLLPSLGALAGDARGVGAALMRSRLSAAPRTAHLQVSIEQAPDPANRVELATERDALGVPRAAVTWRLGETDRRTAATMLDAVRTQWARVGLPVPAHADWLGDAAWARHLEEAHHHMGTTRMATDPRRGVVDTDCAVHGVPGLYVCGGSVFPASGWANPTLTIVALALRLARHLERVLS